MATTAAVKAEVRPDRPEPSFLCDARPVDAGRPRLAISRFFVFADFSLMALSGLLGLSLLFHETPALTLHRPGSVLAPTLLLFPLLVVLFCHGHRLHSVAEIATTHEKQWAILKAISSAWVVSAGYLHFSGASGVSQTGVALAAFVSMGVLLAWHLYARRYVSRKIAGATGRHVLIVGDDDAAQHLRDYLSANQELGYCVKGVVSSCANVLGPVDELRNIIRAHFIDELWIALPEDRHMVKQAVAVARECDIAVRIVPDLYGGVARGVRADPLGEFPSLLVHEKPLVTLGLLWKRWLDIGLAGLALIVSSPVFLLIAVAIKLDSHGSVLYRSTRVGRKGATFTCFKFRTMIQGAEALQDGLCGLNERDAVLFKIRNDPRITGVGHFLRKYSFDELPQFWNVFKGNMSLVGPRPSLPSEVVQYELDHLKRLTVLPGITGLWQVEARRNPSFESYIAFDTEYVDRWSFWLDLKIMLKTPRVVFSGTGQ